MNLETATGLKFHNRSAIKTEDDVYRTNIIGLKVAKYQKNYYLWCEKWWYCFYKKGEFLNFLTRNNIKIKENGVD